MSMTMQTFFILSMETAFVPISTWKSSHQTKASHFARTRKNESTPTCPPCRVFAHSQFASRASLFSSLCVSRARMHTKHKASSCSCGCSAALELPACTSLTHSNAYISLHFRVVIRPLSLAWDHPSRSKDMQEREERERLFIYFETCGIVFALGDKPPRAITSLIHRLVV
jgi:hypothetical protein